MAVRSARTARDARPRRASRFLWLPLSEIESILRGFDVLDAAGALTGEERVLQEDLIGLISGGNAPVIETPWTPSEPFGGRGLRLRRRPFSMRTRPPAPPAPVASDASSEAPSPLSHQELQARAALLLFVHLESVDPAERVL